MSGRGKSAASRRLIETSYEILEERQPTTIRHVAYVLFKPHGLIPDMTKASTNRVSRQLTDAREASIVPWKWIVDETREPERVSAWEDPERFVETCKRAYRKDRWVDQPCRIEVWSEKGTVRGTLAPVLDKYGITFRVMHGYSSATAVYQAAQESLRDGRPLTAFYVGDWDCSGMHMSEVDLPGRIIRYGGEITLVRLALNSLDLPGLPWFPASDKKKDPRYKWFVERYGNRCWELDAMNPVDLRDRVEQAILERIDLSAWKRADVAERAESESLISILSTWPAISRQAQKYEAPR